MDKINWKQKLSSRKLWAGVIAFVMTVVMTMFKEQLSMTQADLLGKGILTLIVYIFGEAGVDIARVLITYKKQEDELEESEVDLPVPDKPPDGGKSRNNQTT